MERIDSFMPFLGIGLEMISEMKERQEEWKERILRQYEESRKYPRKKKKEIRKNLLLEWNIASFDIFDNILAD
jgi:hypothetical protein